MGRFCLLASILFFTLCSLHVRTSFTAVETDDSASIPVVPGISWQTRKPEEVGLLRARLDALRALVGGPGCVVRHGYLAYTWGDPAQSGDIASAVRPVVTTLLFLAAQEGKLKSVDDKVADFEPRLKSLNDGKDGDIT